MKQEWPTGEPAARRAWALTPTSTPKQCQLLPSVIPELPGTIGRRWQEVVLLTTTLRLTCEDEPGMLSTKWLTQSLKGKSSSFTKSPQGDSGKVWTLQLAICHQEGEMSLWAQVTISWPINTHICPFYMASLSISTARWDRCKALQQVLLYNTGKQQDQSCYASAIATLKPDSRQERGEEGKERKSY